jgi:glycosyltransferase involved in cell wall biosynthesis
MSKRIIKPRILVVGPIPPPYGGIATSVINLLNSDLSLYFKIKQLSNSPNRPIEFSGKIDFLNIISFLRFVHNCLREIIKFKPHIIQIEIANTIISFLKNSPIVLLKFISNAKIILSIHGSDLKFLNSYNSLSFFFKMYIRFIFLNCDAIRLLSKKWIKLYITYFKLNNKIVLSIPNGIKVDFININQSILDFGNSNIILYLGAIGPEKGSFDLINAAEILKDKGYDFKILLIGPEMDSGIMEKINKIIRNKNLKDNVKIFNDIEYDRVPQFYNSSDIFILPSYTEGFPMCILEAMASGLPIVSTNVGAIPEFIEEEENGFLVKPGDIKGIVYKIETLLNDKILREKIGNNNIKKVRENFSSYKQAEKFKKLYLNLLELNYETGNS